VRAGAGLAVAVTDFAGGIVAVGAVQDASIKETSNTLIKFVVFITSSWCGDCVYPAYFRIDQEVKVLIYPDFTYALKIKQRTNVPLISPINSTDPPNQNISAETGIHPPGKPEKTAKSSHRPGARVVGLETPTEPAHLSVYCRILF
jgi:hypothetical protein